MIVSTPYTEVYIKKSFLAGNPIIGQDETVFGVLVGIRFIRARAPLYICYLPSLGALYDKVDQCAIFNKPETPDTEIKMEDVGWWDSLSENWQLLQIQCLKGMDVSATMRTKKYVNGTYLWTCDPLPPEGTDYGQATVWHEHKTKTYFFDEDTGVLCCAPNNKMRFWDSSLSPEVINAEDVKWLRVYKDSDYPERTSHEQLGYYGDTDTFDYEKSNNNGQ